MALVEEKVLDIGVAWLVATKRGVDDLRHLRFEFRKLSTDHVP
ncbi:hypothetical protein ACRU3B_13885 [Mycobacterium colombiense]|nr:hypothetical protein [Mycobacterium colombiense]